MAENEEGPIRVRDVVVSFENKNKNKPSPIHISTAHEGPSEPGTSNSDDPNAGGRTPRIEDKEKKIGHRRVDKVTGNVTYKKVPSHYLMRSIQLGMSNSIGSLASAPDRDVLLQDFAVINTINFPQEGTGVTPSHSYGDFRFKSYAPIAFRYFRELFKIKPEDFLHSVCVQELRELSNPGASGSIFYLSCDDRFIIKTVMHKEADFLQKLLPGYYMNLQQNAHTLLPKFFGLFCYQSLGKNIRLLVMNNLLPSSIKMHQKYDLKGSTYKRRASRHERTKGNPTLKDLDFLEECPEGILLESSTYDALMKTISRDCLVLQSFKIMDYSLLVGVHNLDIAMREKSGDSGPEGTTVEHSAPKRFQRNKSMFSAFESIQANAMPVDLGDDYPEGGIPARNAKGERLLVFVGIIDILQNYRLFKKMEHGFKSILHDGDSISVHNPNFYSTRFQEFMSVHVFKKIPSLDLPEVKGPHKKFRSLVQSYMALKHSPSRRRGRERKGTASSSEDPRTRPQDTETPSALTARPDLVPTETKIDPAGLTPFGRSSGRRQDSRTLTRQDTIGDGVTEGEKRPTTRLFASSPVSRRAMARSVSSDGEATVETEVYSMDVQQGCQRLVTMYPHISSTDAMQLLAQNGGDMTACVRFLDRTSVQNPLFRSPDRPSPRPNIRGTSFVSRVGTGRASPSSPVNPPVPLPDHTVTVGRSKFYHPPTPVVSITPGSPQASPGIRFSGGVSPLARSPGAMPSVCVRLPGGLQLSSRGNSTLHISQPGTPVDAGGGAPSFRISLGGGGDPSPRVRLGAPSKPPLQHRYEPEFIQKFMEYQRGSLSEVEGQLNEVTARMEEVVNDVNEMEQQVLLRRKHSICTLTTANAETVRQLHQETRKMQADINAMNKELIAQKEESKKNAELKRQTGAKYFDQMAANQPKGSVATLIDQGCKTLSTVPSTGESQPIGGERWSCVACTYLNHAAMSYCEICSIPRVQERTIVPDQGDWVVYDLVKPNACGPESD